MTRFDANDATTRRELVADAVRAHRDRESAFLTVEADRAVPGEENENENENQGEGENDLARPPWVQYDIAEGLLNLDCTDDELDALNSLVGEYPEFRVEELTRPEEANGVNARILARTDPDRVGGFVEAVFRRVYGFPADYRLWVVGV